MSELKIPAWLGSSSAIGSVGRWFKWWKDGLLRCLPGWLRRKLFPSAAPSIFQISDKSVVLSQPHGGQPLELGGINLADRGIDYLLARITQNRSHKLVLRVPREWILTRRVSLPAAAAENLRQVIGFEIDRLTPFTPDQIFYDSRIVERNKDSKMLAIELAFLPRHKIKPWLSILTSRGVHPSMIDTDALWSGIDFLPPEDRPRRSQVERTLNLLIWLAPIILLTLALALPLWQKRTVAIELIQQVDEERRKADEVLEIRNKLEQNRKSERFVLEKRSESPPAVDVLRLATDLLPDDTWIQQFTLKQGQLELRGMSNQATALIGLMDASPRFSSVDFRSPVVQTKGQERFYLTAKLVPPKELPSTPAAERKDPGLPAGGSSPSSGLPATGKGTTEEEVPADPGTEASKTGELARPTDRAATDAMTGAQGRPPPGPDTPSRRQPVRTNNAPGGTE